MTVLIVELLEKVHKILDNYGVNFLLNSISQ